MFHDTMRANLLYARPGATEQEIWAALEAAQIAPWCARFRTGWTRSSATADIGSQAGNVNGWPSPGCC